MPWVRNTVSPPLPNILGFSLPPPPPTPGLIAEQFLESTASQLTYHGLCELTATVTEGELSVFFRNNHFSTMIKYQVGAGRVRKRHLCGPPVSTGG